ncbi:hypothetical protein [uncultured Tissierella sp.]|uniref:hypothetical protein n=1 Tax=uncultured Tissierella sp. TaxID=448160 RepID=UPI002805CBA7|nr:hypothetical protein [uncultured Tissierella sp.]MDU5081996.1 hypothetical protein [Bacillota bacterium]
MIKTCQICHKEFETTYPNKKYCSKECNREAIREADRLRKRKEREIIKKKRTAEEVERRRQKKAEIDKRTEEIAREKKADLEKRLKKRDPKAIMEITNHFDIEYWEAYKEDFMQDHFNKNYIQYVNDISVYDDDFPNKVIDSIKEKGSICSRLVRNKSSRETTSNRINN